MEKASLMNCLFSTIAEKLNAGQLQAPEFSSSSCSIPSLYHVYPTIWSIKYFCSHMIGLNMSHGQILYEDIPQFSKLCNATCCEKYLKDNKHNCFHLTLKICLDICPLTLSVPQSSQFSATLLEKCSLLRTDNVHGQISKHIFSPNGGYCLFRLSSEDIDRRITLLKIKSESQCL